MGYRQFLTIYTFDIFHSFLPSEIEKSQVPNCIHPNYVLAIGATISPFVVTNTDMAQRLDYYPAPAVWSMMFSPGEALRKDNIHEASCYRNDRLVDNVRLPKVIIFGARFVVATICRRL